MAKMIVRSQILAFAGVGTIGFLIDAAILTILVSGYDWSHYMARLISFACAVSVTWLFNRLWTFRHYATASRKREYQRYFGVQLVGALINYSIFSVCIATSRLFSDLPVMPLALGSLVAMVFNFVGARNFVYADERATPVIEKNPLRKNCIS